MTLSIRRPSLISLWKRIVAKPNPAAAAEPERKRLTPPAASLAVAVTLIPCLICPPTRSVFGIVAAVFVLLALPWLIRWNTRTDAWLRYHPLARWLLLALGSGLLTASLLGDNLRARWWIIDDHEIVAMLGVDGRLGFDELAERLANHAEVGNAGSSIRFRPVYYILRHLEAFLWGDSPTLWYASRLLMFGVSLALYWHLLWRWLGGLGGSVVLACLLTLRMWPDIWARLGPAEIYCVPAFAFFLTGATTLAIAARRGARLSLWIRALSWMLVVAGSVGALGSKENFVPILPLTWALAAWLLWKRQFDAVALIDTLAATALNLLIIFFIVKAVSGGVDLYGRDVTLPARLWVLVRAVTTWESISIAILGGAAGWIALRARKSSQSRHALSSANVAVLLIGALWLALISQFVVYGLEWSSGSRYGFPGALAVPLAVVTFGSLLLQLSHVPGENNQRFRTGLGWSLGILVVVAVAEGPRLPRAAAKNVERTVEFTARLENIAATLRARPREPVVFVSNHVDDYEPIFACAVFLKQYDVENPLFLQLAGYTPETLPSRFQAELARVLQNTSQSGTGAFEPWESLPHAEGTMAIGFSGEPTPPYESLGIVYRGALLRFK